ncbi:MAG TPA: hypothetical protein VH589_28470 [Trebonia sp.]
MLNIAFPAAFRVGGPPAALAAVSAAVLAVGVVNWAWPVRRVADLRARRGSGAGQDLRRRVDAVQQDRQDPLAVAARWPGARFLTCAACQAR